MDLTTRLETATRLIDRWLAYQVYSNRLPGLSIGVVYKDRVIFSKGYGYANVEDKVKASAETCYRIASFSKIFTAIAVLQLFEQGKLHLDERVQRYVPWCTSEQADETAQMTIRQLLSHTSGIDRDGKLPQWVTYEFPSLQQFQQQIAGGSMVYAPAERWKYSNYGYTLLGAVIQAVSGISYEEYVTEHIVKQLNLTHTAPVLTDDVMQQLALGYSRNIPEHKRETFPHIETHAMASATGFSSNIRDFCQFMMAQFDGDTRLLKDGTKREMRRIQWRREGFISDWCLGFETWKINQSRYYGHGGSFQGYRSRFGFDPERKIGLVVFSNAVDAPSQDLAHGALGIIDYVITHFSELETAEHPLEQSERYEGTFRSIWGDVSVAAVHDTLLLYAPGALSLEDGLSQLRHEQGHQFRIVNGNGFDHVGELLRFELDSQGVAQRIYVGPNPSDRFEYARLIGEE